MSAETLLSVGIDLGTTTTQLVFSRLTVRNEGSAFSVPNYTVAAREVLRRSAVHFTPLRSERELDAEAIARIVDARTALDMQVKDFERRDREGRRAAVQFTVDNIKSCEGVPELDIPINPSWLNKSTRQAEIHEDIKRIIAAYKRECEETRRMEQAKADRIALVEATAKAQAEQHGFALPLSKFAACLTPDISGEDAAGIIGQVYAAEAKAREESKPAHVVKPAEPRPDSFIEQEEGFPFAPPVNVACTLTLSVKYAPKYEDTVQEALAMLRTVGVVTVF